MTPRVLGAGLAALSALACVSQPGPTAGGEDSGWRVVAGPDGTRYSHLAQITTENVDRLEVAWTYDTGDAFPESEMQCNPIVIDGVLYATTPRLRVIALDAATGSLQWSFDPLEPDEPIRRFRNRGLTYWPDGDGSGRLFVAAQQWLYALDASTGAAIETFGEGGRIDLREGLGRPAETLSVSMTSPGVVYRDLLIVGSITSEDLPAAPGDIRAFDVRTGERRWTFRTIPHPGEPGYETWPTDAWRHTGGANNWSGMTLDEARGLVFVPTGSASFDFYGADRLGDNLYANTLLALDAATGRRVWHYQTVRHDLWDRDLPAPPTLVTLTREGGQIDAVAQITKSGHVFVFDRETGTPLFPIEERPVPASDVPGEQTAPFQPLPLVPPPLSRQAFTEELVTDRTPEAREAVLARFRQLRSGGQFTPPSLQGTVIFPGLDGGGEWGGAAFDADSGLLYVNANEMPWILRLVDRERPSAETSARGLYLSQCAACHGRDGTGTLSDIPSLADIGGRLTDRQLARIIREGTGRMPPFPHLSDEEVRALADHLVAGEDRALESEPGVPGEAEPASTIPFLPYALDGYNKFLDPDGYPAVKPPWGTLNAIDLDRGEIRWSIPFGEHPELAVEGEPPTGSENYGGPVVTAGGLLFIGATNFDNKFRAFDKASGRLLWSADLPAAGNATPAVYQAGGRQFVVIAAGGGKSGQPPGGTYVAFALPD